MATVFPPKHCAGCQKILTISDFPLLMCVCVNTSPANKKSYQPKLPQCRIVSSVEENWGLFLTVIVNMYGSQNCSEF